MVVLSTKPRPPMTFDVRLIRDDGTQTDPIVYMAAPHFELYRKLHQLAEQLVGGVETGTATTTILEQLADQVEQINATVTSEPATEVVV